MPTLISRPRITPLALAATLLAAFVFLFAWPQSAAAHDTLIESNPAADSSIETLPAELTLTFSAALIPGEGSTEVAVTDAAGESVTDGDAILDGALVTQPLVAEADAGEYHVLWKVVSSDGHPTSGEFRFTVTTSTLASPEEPQESPTAESTVAPAPETTASAVPADDPNMAAESSFSPGWLIGGAVVLIIIVILLIVLLRRRKPSDSESDTPAER